MTWNDGFARGRNSLDRGARRWLCGIHVYIAVDNPVAAAKVASGIFARAQVLLRFPEIGYKYRDEPDGEIRILLYGPCRIAYLRRPSWAIDVSSVFPGDVGFFKVLALMSGHNNRIEFAPAKPVAGPPCRSAA